jgi:DNA-directed RNA polymerase subunit H (RpoH/RPB5)
MDPLVLRTCESMLKDVRKYTIVRREESKWLCTRRNMANADLELQFTKEDKDSVSSAIVACNTKHLILVCNRAMKWQAKKLIATAAAATGKRIEVFTAEELMFNPLDIPLVPVHMLIEGKELDDLLARFPKDKLPIIDPRTDIVARFMGLREDDVVKILRPVNPMLVDVETMQIPHPSESLMYRVCRVPSL